MSELVGNAVEHAGTEIDVWVSMRGATVHLAVQDRSTRPPLLRGSDPTRPGGVWAPGMGLRIVAATATAWGALPSSDGKVVLATPCGGAEAGVMTFFTDGGARLHVAVQHESNRITVTLTGELDRVSGPPLADVLDAAMDGGIRHVCVSMAQVGFVDVGGVRVLLRAHQVGKRRGVVFLLQDPQPHVVWLLRGTEAADLLLGAPLAPEGEPAMVPHAADGRDDRADGRDKRAGRRDERADERDRRADERDRSADMRDDTADERDRQADDREEWADDRERLAQERNHLLDERQQKVQEHQRWEDVREELADARDRDLRRREQEL